MNDIGGNVCIRDGDETDFCWREAVESLLPVCDTVTVCDGGSTDGTREAIQRWSKRDSRVRLLDFPWDHPKGELHFWVRWLNYAREHVPNYWHLQLDADEVLHEDGLNWISDFTKTKAKKSAIFDRLNFWKDPWHLSPKGVKCGYEVLRLAPQSLWMPSDYPLPQAQEILSVAVKAPVRIFHYGCVRKVDAIIVKAARYTEWVNNAFDPRVPDAKTKAGNFWDNLAQSCGWKDRVEVYPKDDPRNKHPECVKPWLRAHGFEV